MKEQGQIKPVCRWTVIHPEEQPVSFWKGLSSTLSAVNLPLPSPAFTLILPCTVGTAQMGARDNLQISGKGK